jgi:hypothetical protein
MATVFVAIGATMIAMLVAVAMAVGLHTGGIPAR